MIHNAIRLALALFVILSAMTVYSQNISNSIPIYYGIDLLVQPSQTKEQKVKKPESTGQETSITQASQDESQALISAPKKIEPLVFIKIEPLVFIPLLVMFIVSLGLGAVGMVRYTGLYDNMLGGWVRFPNRNLMTSLMMAIGGLGVVGTVVSLFLVSC